MCACIHVTISGYASCPSLLLPGTLDLNLHGMPEPRRSADSCDTDQLPEEGREVVLVDLFQKKRMSGWWPFYEVNKEVRELTVG